MFDQDALKRRLLAIAPELKGSVEEHCELFGEDDSSASIFFDDHLGPYLAEVLEAGDRDAHCRELFDFFEELASSGEEQAVLCVAYALPRTLQEHAQALQRAERYLGPRSRALVGEYLLTWTKWGEWGLPWESAGEL